MDSMKTQVQTIVSSEKVQEIKNECKYCHKSFSRQDALSRHIDKYCKAKKSLDDSKEQLFQRLLAEHDELMGLMAEVKQLKKENKEFKQIIAQQTNIQTQNNTIHNTLNIKLVAYGKEDISAIPVQVYKQLINKGFMSVPALVEKVHFDKNKPENQNIYMSNMRDDYILIYDGEDWKLTDKKETLDGLYDEKVYILENKFQELIKELPEPVITKFKRFLDKADNDSTKDGIKKELRLMLYNHRKLVESTRKLIAQQ
jgi:hypothetical protein